MKLKIYRDDLRLVQKNICPYLEQVCEMRFRQSQAEAKQNTAIIRSLFSTVKIKIDKKLFTEYNSFTLKFTDAEAIVFYQLLMIFPAKAEEVYLTNLRQEIINILHKQIAALQ